MRRIATAFFTLAWIAVPGFVSVTGQEMTQSNCSLTELRGVRLGMSTEQVLALFPRGSKRREIVNALERAKEAGDQTVYVSFEPTDATGDAFVGVDAVTVGLNKGHVVDLGLQYVGPTWRSIDEWIAKLSEALKLPGAREWKAGPAEAPNKILKCGGNEIEAAIQGGGASIRIRNIDSFREMDEHAKARDDRRRREFKP